MLAEVNFFAERLRLHAHLPIMESAIRQLYVGPPRLLRFLGAVDTDEYSFGFAESGRLRFLTKLVLLRQACVGDGFYRLIPVLK